MPTSRRTSSTRREFGPSSDALDDDPTFLELLQRVDAADQRRLCPNRRAADHDALALGDIEVDVAQHVKIAVPLAERG